MFNVGDFVRVAKPTNYGMDEKKELFEIGTICRVVGVFNDNNKMCYEIADHRYSHFYLEEEKQKEKQKIFVLKCMNMVLVGAMNRVT